MISEMKKAMERGRNTASFRVQNYTASWKTTKVHHDGAEYRVTTYKIVPHGSGVGQWGYGYVVARSGRGIFSGADQNGYVTRAGALRDAKDRIKAGFYTRKR
jgi:hypothetical protein